MGDGRKRKRIDPEMRAYWEDARRTLEAAIARSYERSAAIRAAEERRRERLRRWSFGLLGR